MVIKLCDLCNEKIEPKSGKSFNGYDLCNDCVMMVRCGLCIECEGTCKVRVLDRKQTNAEATCGENRPVYKTISCNKCLKIRDYING